MKENPARRVINSASHDRSGFVPTLSAKRLLRQGGVEGIGGGVGCGVGCGVGGAAGTVLGFAGGLFGGQRRMALVKNTGR